MKTLFVNGNRLKPQCSIFEAGELSAYALSLSRIMQLDYCPLTDGEVPPDGYDLAVFNFHPATLNLPREVITSIAPKRVLLSFERATYWDPWYIPNPWGDLRDIFDYSAVPDPELVTDDPSVIVLPRLCPNAVETTQAVVDRPPVITMFGLTPRTTGPSSKLIEPVIRYAQEEFGQATIRIHYPRGSHVPDYWRAELDRDIELANKLTGIDIQVTTDYKSRQDLMRFLGESDLNAFFYSPNRDETNMGVANLPTAIDFAAGARRPLAVSDSECARHYLRYLTPYPKWSLRDSLQKSMPIVQEIADRWSPQAFCEAFDSFLEKHV